MLAAMFNHPWFAKHDNQLADVATGLLRYTRSTVTLAGGTTSARQIQVAAKVTF
jgi:hypothetical protein